MSKEEDFFKENYLEYVTEKGEFLSPYWDLFSAGVICATFELKEENAKLKEKLNNLASVAEVRLANWLKYEQAYNETEELLYKQIEATYKVVEENKELKEKLKPENCLKLLAKEGYIKFSSEQLTKAKEIIKSLCKMVREINNPNVQLTNVDCSLAEAEQFLKEE